MGTGDRLRDLRVTLSCDDTPINVGLLATVDDASVEHAEHQLVDHREPDRGKEGNAPDRQRPDDDQSE